MLFRVLNGSIGSFLEEGVVGRNTKKIQRYMILLQVFSIDAHLSLPAFIAWLSSSSLLPDLCARPSMVTFLDALASLDFKLSVSE